MPSHFDPQKLSVNNFKILSENVEIPEYFERDKINHFVSRNHLSLAFNLEAGLIRTESHIEIESSSSCLEEAKVRYKFIFIYHYEGLEEIASLEDADLRVDAQLGITLSAMTYSTIRGVLLVKLSDTVFQDFILPVIKPSLPN